MTRALLTTAQPTSSEGHHHDWPTLTLRTLSTAGSSMRQPPRSAIFSCMLRTRYLQQHHERQRPPQPRTGEASWQQVSRLRAKKRDARRRAAQFSSGRSHDASGCRILWQYASPPQLDTTTTATATAATTWPHLIISSLACLSSSASTALLYSRSSLPAAPTRSQADSTAEHNHG